MKTSHLILAILPLLTAASLTAGQQGGKEPVPVVMEEAAAEKDWEVMLSAPLWAVGIEGDVGVGGIGTVAFDLPLEDILENLDMVAALNLEVRYRQWGLMLSGLYLDISGSSEASGDILQSIDVGLQSVLAEAALFYRIVEGEAGYLDVFAGARYVYLGTDLGFQIDSEGLDDFSHNLVDDIAGRVGSAVRTQAISQVVDQVTNRDVVRAIRNVTPVSVARIERAVNRSGRLRNAVRELAEAQLREREVIVAGDFAAARARARAAVDKAEDKLADAIEDAVREVVPKQVSGSESWIDPFVGLRGRYNFYPPFYFAGRADIGGFGVGSELTWNAQAALGVQISRSFSTELGYRYFSTDYDKDGFLFDASISGIFLGLNLVF